MMSNRYFIYSPIRWDYAVLDGLEAHHAIHVMRARPGDQVTLFDGSGSEFTAQVETVGRGRVDVRVLEQTEIDRELPIGLTLAVALPKGDRQRWLVEKAVELGVSRVVPLNTSRSVAQATPGALMRLRRTVVEASKQCGRNRLTEVTQAKAWDSFVTTAPANAVRLVAHPRSEGMLINNWSPLRLKDITRGQNVLMAIGPEGGLTDDEFATAAAAGWRPIDLGPRILRIETAAILLTALVLQSLR